MALAYFASACTGENRSSARKDIDGIIRLEKGRVLVESDSVPFAADPEGAVISREGNIVFADRFDQRVVVFSPNGKQLLAVGRRGNGPGEFRFIESVYSITKDSLAAFDRQRESMAIIHQGKISPRPIGFSQWKFGENGGLRVVGRFADGRWVGLQTAARIRFTQGVYVITDTPKVVVGVPTAEPVKLLELMPRRSVDLVVGFTAARLELSEIAPAIGAICDSGIVLVDTAGIHVFDTRGGRVSEIRLPVTRIPISRLVTGKEGVVERALYSIPIGDGRTSAAKSLASFAEGVDSLMHRPTIDTRGSVWFPRLVAQGTAYVRIGYDGASRESFGGSEAPMLIDDRTLVSMGFDSTFESISFSATPIPSARTLRKSRVGWCGSPFRY